MYQFKLVLIIALIMTLSGCDNARKNAPDVLALRDISGFRVNKVIWGPEYSYWNPIICLVVTAQQEHGSGV